VLLLNARHELERKVLVGKGSLNASIVHPREVSLPAITRSAASIVLVHNHPSGDPEPSEEDLTITRRLVEVGSSSASDYLTTSSWPSAASHRSARGNCSAPGGTTRGGTSTGRTRPFSTSRALELENCFHNYPRIAT